MPTDPQPEEAATRPIAAAASFAGSLAQTTIYGRGIHHRAEQAGKKQQAGSDHEPAGKEPAGPARADTTTTPGHGGAPATTPAAAGTVEDGPPPADLGAGLAERATGRLVRSLDDPAEYAELLFTGMAGDRPPPGPAAQSAAAGGIGAELTERAVGGPQRGLDEIDARHTEQSTAANDVDPAGPQASVEMRVAASAQDAAAAAARLAQGQLVEPPALAPPAPGIGPLL